MFSQKEKLKGRRDIGPEAMKKKMVKVEPKERDSFGNKKIQAQSY